MKKYQYLASWDDQTLTRVGEPVVVLGDSNVSQVEVTLPSDFLLDPTKAESRMYFLLPGEKESDHDVLETAVKDENGDSHVTWTIKHVHSQKGGRLAFSLTLIGDDAQWDSRTAIIPVYESRYQPESEEAEEPYTGRLDALEGTMASIRGEFDDVVDEFEELKETATLGTPIPKSLASEMVEGGVYLYTGTEPGYTAGHVYYYVNGTLTDGGVYGGTAVDATLTQSGAAADAKVTGDKIAEIKEDLREYEDIFTGNVDESIRNWLDAHPEATTTVQDGSLTYKKLVNGTLGFVTPEMYGAVGDGVTDDTNSLQLAVNAASENRKVVLAVGVYMITAPVNFSGVMCGTGTLKTAGNDTRFEGAMLNITEDAIIDGLTFDCLSTVEFVLADKFTKYNNAIRCNNSGSVTIKNCTFKNLYNAFLTWYNSRHLRLINNIFNASNKSNSHYACCISLSTSTNTTDTVDIIGNTFLGYVGDGDTNDNAGGIIISNLNIKRTLISNNTFENLGRYGNQGQSRICVIDAYFNVSNLIIVKNEILNCNWNAIRLHGGNNNRVSYNTISIRSETHYPEWVILVSDAQNSTGEESVGVTNVEISHNYITTGTTHVNHIIWVSGVSTFGIHGAVENLMIFSNNIDGAAANGMIALDTTIKSCKIIGNTITHNQDARENTNAIMYISQDDYVFDADVEVLNNVIRTNGTCVQARLNVRSVICNNRLYDGVGYAIRGGSSAIAEETIAVNNFIEGYSGIYNIGKAYNNIISVSYTSGRIVGVTDAQNNFIY